MEVLVALIISTPSLCALGLKYRLHFLCKRYETGREREWRGPWEYVGRPHYTDFTRVLSSETHLDRIAPVYRRRFVGCRSSNNSQSCPR